MIQKSQVREAAERPKANGQVKGVSELRLVNISNNLWVRPDNIAWIDRDLTRVMICQFQTGTITINTASEEEAQAKLADVLAKLGC